MSESSTSKTSGNLEKPKGLTPEEQKKKIKEAFVKLAETLKPS